MQTPDCNPTYEWPLQLSWPAILPLMMAVGLIAIISIQLFLSQHHWLSVIVAISSYTYCFYEGRLLRRQYRGKLIFVAQPIESRAAGWYWAPTAERPDILIPLRLKTARLTHEQFVVLSFSGHLFAIPSFSKNAFTQYAGSFKHFGFFIHSQRPQFCITSSSVGAHEYRQLRRLIHTQQALM